MLNKSNQRIKCGIDSGNFTVTENGIIIGRRGKPLKNKLDQVGRPRVKMCGENVYVCRVVGYVKYGDLIFSSDLEIHHRDENPQNNHPDNLELVYKGTHYKYHRATKNKQSKLTWEQVRRIRELCKLNCNKTELAREFKVSDVTIARVINNERYKEVF